MRISKPLLRLVVEERKVLQTIVGNAEDALPDGVTLHGLLKTCRPYNEGTQEAVQLVSLLTSLFAWLLLETRPPATLLSLRPGAAVVGDQAQAQAVVHALANAAESVDRAGIAAAADIGSEFGNAARAEARQKAALELVSKIAARTTTPRPGEVALTTNCKFAVDMVCNFFKGEPAVLLGQCKGKKTGLAAATNGGDLTMSVSEAEKYMQNMVTVGNVGFARAQALNNPDQCADPPSAEPIVGLIGHELLTARRAGPSLSNLWTLPAALHEHRELCNALAESRAPFVIVIAREHMMGALGPIFGGIAARC